MGTTPASRERIKVLFANAMAVGPAARVAVLDEACGGDAELRTAVEDLLNNYESAQRFFAQFPSDFARDVLDLAQPRSRTFSAGDLVADRFHIVGFLAAGGMGEVYEAEDRLLDHQRVALKTLPAHIAGDAAGIARLTREIALARRVTHPNVCRVFDVDQHVSSSQVTIAFFTMELLEGETLAARLRRSGPLSLSEAGPLVSQMAAALEAAHAAGVVHGDFKPGNVVLVTSAAGRERAVVTDFGLARRVSTDSAPGSMATTTGGGWGTPVYMAPEQFAGRRATRASDVYALAAVVFEMVTGTPAIGAESTAAIALNPLWRSAIQRGLDHNPDARFQTVQELISALSGDASPSGTGVQQIPGSSIDARAMEIDWRREMGVDSGLPRDAAARFETTAEFVGALEARPAWARALWVPIGAAAAALAAVLLAWPSVTTALLGRPKPAALAPVAGRTIAVLPFDEPNGTAATAAFGRGLAAIVAERLRLAATTEGLAHIRVLPAAEVMEASPLTPAGVGRTLGANVIVSGRIARPPHGTVMTLNLDQSPNDQTIIRPAESVAFDAVADDRLIVPAALAQVAQIVGVTLMPATIQRIGEGGTRDARAEDLFVRGRGYLLALDLDAAIDSFQRAIQIDAGFGAAYAALSDAYRQKYKASRLDSFMQQAQRFGDDAIKLSPSAAYVHLIRGFVYGDTGQHDRAIRELLTALHVDPDARDARQGLADAYEAEGQLANAEASYRQEIASYPQYWSPHVAYGSFLIKQGRYREAETSLLNGLTFAPDNVRAIGNLAGLYILTERFAAAEAELQRGLAIGPSVIGYNNLAWVQIFQGRFARAVPLLEAAVKLPRADSVHWGNLARAYRWTDQRKPASATYQAAITLAAQELAVNPRDARIRSNLACLWAETGHRSPALAEIAGALKQAPSDVSVIFRSALVYELLGDRRAAANALESAARGGHSNADIRRHPDLARLRGDPGFPGILTAQPKPALQ